MTLILDDYDDVARRLRALQVERTLPYHVFRSEDGRCCYCMTHEGSPAAQYHPECARVPGAETYGGHLFENGRCVRCLAAFGSVTGKLECCA